MFCWRRGFDFVSTGEEKLWIPLKWETSWLEEVIVYQTALESNLNWKIRLTNVFHLIRHNLPKRKFPKVRVGTGFCFYFPEEWRHSTKKSEDHWTNDTSEEKVQIIQRKCPLPKRVNCPSGITHFQQIKFRIFSQMFVSAGLYRHIGQMVFL